MAYLADDKLVRATRYGKVNPGVAFARGVEVDEVKAAARNQVLDYMSPGSMDTLVISALTMPGMRWQFERELVHRWGPSGKKITSVEREPNIFHGSLAYIPGRRSARGISIHWGPEYARQTVRTYDVSRYLCCEFETLAMSRESPWGDKSEIRYYFNAAWLDFNGCLTKRRADAIESLLQHHCLPNVRLAVTFLNGKWPAESRDFWGTPRWNNVVRWFGDHGAILLDHMEYKTTSPMWQFVFQVNR